MHIGWILCFLTVNFIDVLIHEILQGEFYRIQSKLCEARTHRSAFDSYSPNYGTFPPSKMTYFVTLEIIPFENHNLRPLSILPVHVQTLNFMICEFWNFSKTHLILHQEIQRHLILYHKKFAVTPESSLFKEILRNFLLVLSVAKILLPLTCFKPYWKREEVRKKAF